MAEKSKNNPPMLGGGAGLTASDAIVHKRPIFSTLVHVCPTLIRIQDRLQRLNIWACVGNGSNAEASVAPASIRPCW